jgi:hypothetical protein
MPQRNKIIGVGFDAKEEVSSEVNVEKSKFVCSCLATRMQNKITVAL